jgi:hypothetical protein
MAPGTSDIVVFARLELTTGEPGDGATGNDAVADEVREDKTGASAGRCATGGIRSGGRGTIRETAAPGTDVEAGTS